MIIIIIHHLTIYKVLYFSNKSITHRNIRHRVPFCMPHRNSLNSQPYLSLPNTKTPRIHSFKLKKSSRKSLSTAKSWFDDGYKKTKSLCVTINFLFDPTSDSIGYRLGKPRTILQHSMMLGNDASKS